MSAERVAKIRAALEQALAPSHLEVTDESHLHVGHAGARDGRGHFRVDIVAEQFRDVPLIKRHRLVFAAVGELMQTDIHALSIDARTPEP